MATRRWFLLALVASVILALAGCNSGSTYNPQNPPPPPPPPTGVGIAFPTSPPPPSSVQIGTTGTITVNISNDTNVAGVGWNLTCQSGNCGTLAPTQSCPASGCNSGSSSYAVSTTYTPPATMTGNTEIVNVVGFAIADPTKNVLASITVTAFGSNLTGAYVLDVQGVEDFVSYQFAGVILLDGNGNITGGEQTVNLLNQNTGAFESHFDVIPSGSGSTYFVGPDGRGTITINLPGDAAVVQETFSFAFLSNSHALIAQTQAPATSAVNVPSASGTMDMQSSTIASPSAGYAFVVNGVDFSSGEPTSIGGILNVDSPNTISGVGSVIDQNLAGLMTGNKALSGTVSSPDNFGAVSFSLSVPSFTSTTNFTFQGYVVDATHIKLIESDDGGFGAVSGLALGQGSATGTFLDDTALSGTYVFGVLGVDPASGLPATFTSAGVVSFDGAGNLTNGFTDTVFQAYPSPTTGLPVQISGTFGGTYGVGPVGTGRVHSLFDRFASPNGGFAPQYIFYLAGNGNPALVLAAGDSGGFNYPFVGAGMAYPQSALLTFSGNYGLNYVQENATAEYDGTAQMNVTPPSLSGFADVGINVDQGFSANFSSSSCSTTVVGCFSGSFNTGSGNALQGSNNVVPNVTFTADFYMIDQTQGFFVENDLAQQAQPQVSLGYFATSVLPNAPAPASASRKRPRR
jgi:hypothetical protein